MPAKRFLLFEFIAKSTIWFTGHTSAENITEPTAHREVSALNSEERKFL